MKKYIFLIFLFSVTVNAVVPMNIGNKWWYQAKIWQSGTAINYRYEKHIYTVIKDTIINTNIHKKIKISKYGWDNKLLSNNYEIWYEILGKFYKFDKNYDFYECYYNINQQDSLYHSGYYEYSILNGTINIFNNNYQKQNYHIFQGGPGATEITDWETIKDIGIYKYSKKVLGYEYDFQITLCAFQSNGEILGDTTQTVNLDYNFYDKKDIEISNYPNPFNPTTTISFYNNKSNMVKLTVINSKGEAVSTLINEYKNAGTHKVCFDASLFSSGLYYYRLETPTKIINKKMILIK